MEKEFSTLEELGSEVKNRPCYIKIWCSIKYPILRFFDFRDKINRIKWFYWRGKRGFADCDTWDIASYLTSIMPSMLKEFKKNCHGYPGWGDASTPEKWDIIIDKIIGGFEAGQRVANDEYFEITNSDILTREPTREEVLSWGEASKVDEKIFNDNMKIFIRWFFHLWD